MKTKKSYNFGNISGFVLFSEIQKSIKKNVINIIIISILALFSANIYFFKFFLDPHLKTDSRVIVDKKFMKKDLVVWNKIKIFLENDNKFEILLLDFEKSFLVFKVKDQKYPIILSDTKFVIKNEKKISLDYLINHNNSEKIREELLTENNLYVENLVNDFFSYYELKIIYDHNIYKKDIISSTEEALISLLPKPTINALDDISIVNYKFLQSVLLEHSNILQGFNIKNKLFYIKTKVVQTIITEIKYPILLLILFSILFIIFFNTIFILFLIFRINFNVK